MDNYAKAQELELEWWKNYPFTPYPEWREYDRVFLPYYPQEPVPVAVDVGSGPIPIFCNPNILYTRGISVDPLNPEYAKLDKYAKYLTRPFERMQSPSEIESGTVDCCFCLNTLDHLPDPSSLVVEIVRVLRETGLLFLFVDVDRAPDRLHATVSRGRLHGLLAQFDEILWLEKPSWKFNNSTLWFVGQRKKA